MTTIKSRVFVIEPHEKKGIDISPLASFGDVVYLFPLHGDRTSIFSPDFPEDVISALDKYRFDPDNDYVAVVGMMVPVVLAVAAISQEFEYFKILVYDKRDMGYKSLFIGDSNVKTGH